MSYSPPYFLTGIRVLILVITLFSVLCLLFASNYASTSREQLQQAKHQLKSSKQQLNDYTKLQQRFIRFKSFSEKHQQLSKLINTTELKPSLWSVRDLSVQSITIPRNKMQDYLAGIKHQSKYFFVPTAFNLTAEYAEDDLFSWLPGDGKNLELTLQGQYYIRRQP
ncbi:MAG: hypothetical protein QM479_11660 [Pseudomonadota bacterium]